MRIRDLQDQPIRHAVIRDIRNDEEFGVSDSEGMVRVPVWPEGWVAVSAAGYATAVIERKTDPIRLEPASTIAGQICDARGVALVGAAVRLDFGNVPYGRFRTPEQQTETDSDGRFQFNALPFGLFGISVQTEGYASEYLRSVPSGETGLRIPMRRLVRIEGVVVRDGLPVQAKIYDKPAMYPYERASWTAQLGETDADGRFSFAAEPNRRLELMAVHERWGSGTVVVDTSSPELHSGIELTIDEGIVLRSYFAVQVVDENGTPAQDMVAQWRLPVWRPASTRLESIGRAMLPPIPSRLPEDFWHTSGFTLPRTRSDERGVLRREINVPPHTTIRVKVSHEFGWTDHFDHASITLTTTDSSTPVAHRVVVHRTVVRRLQCVDASGKPQPFDLPGADIAGEIRDSVWPFRVRPGRPYVVTDRRGRQVAEWTPPKQDKLTQLTIPAGATAVRRIDSRRYRRRRCRQPDRPRLGALRARLRLLRADAHDSGRTVRDHSTRHRRPGLDSCARVRPSHRPRLDEADRAPPPLHHRCPNSDARRVARRRLAHRPHAHRHGRHRVLGDAAGPPTQCDRVLPARRNAFVSPLRLQTRSARI